MNIRVTTFFSAGFYAWTESWWLQNYATLAGAQQAATSAANLRAAMLGYGAQIDSIRLTTDQKTRQVFVLPVGTYATTGLGSTAAAGLGTSDEPYSSVLVRFNSTEGFPKDTYVSGFPDGVVTVGSGVPPVVGVGPAWLLAFNAWVDRLKQSAYCWRSVQRGIGFGLSAPVQQFTVNALPPGEIGAIVLAGNANFLAGETVQLSGFSRILGRGARQINGRWSISSVESSTTPVGTIYYLRGSAGVDLSQVTRFGSITQVEYTYRAVSSAAIRGATHRKRGVRSGRPLGRSKIRS